MKSFWRWYEHHLFLNTAIAATLFLLQVVHLYWLFTDVILYKLTGTQYFPVSSLWERLLAFADYTELPALVSITLLYVHEFRKHKNFKSILFIILLNTQWLHLFWITDEFVVHSFTPGASILFPAWLAWVAISIDYLEIPVIFDTLKKLFASKRLQDVKAALKE